MKTYRKRELFNLILVLIVVAGILWFLLAVFGCSHRYADKLIYNPDGNIASRTKLTETQVCYWTKYKGFNFVSDGFKLLMGESEQHPDANSVEAVAGGVAGAVTGGGI